MLALQDKQLTLFAPSNLAWRQYMQVLGVDEAGLLALGPRLLSYLLSYHLLPDLAVTTAGLRSRRSLPTALEGYNLTITRSGTDVVVASPDSRAKVARADLQAGKAVVHIVDHVLVPFDLYRAPYVPLYNDLGDVLKQYKLNVFKDLLIGAGLAPLLNRTDITGTVLAPTDQAFAGLAAALAARSGAVAAQAALDMLRSSPQLKALVAGDHMHLAEALAGADLAARPSLAVGLDPAAYGQPGAPSLVVRTDPATGRITLSGFTSAAITHRDILAGASGKLAVHVMNAVLMSGKSAIALGLLTAAPEGEGLPPQSPSLASLTALLPATSVNPLPAPSVSSPPHPSPAPPTPLSPVGSPPPSSPVTPPPPSPAPAPSPTPSPWPSLTPGTTYGSLLTAFQREPDLAALVITVNQGQLASTLTSMTGPLTIFAPGNAAFAKLMAGLAAADTSLPAAVAALAPQILGGHLHLGAALSAAGLKDGSAVPVGLDPRTYSQPNASTVRVRVNSSGAYLATDSSQALILRSIQAGPALIYVIDTVLLSDALAAQLRQAASSSTSGGPPAAPSPPPPPASHASALAALQQEAELLHMLQLAVQAGLAATLGSTSTPLTLFAPTDLAFGAFMARLTAANPTAASTAALGPLIGTILGGHLHLGAALPAAGLKDGSVVPVGLDPRTYSQSNASTLHVYVDAVGVFLAQNASQALVLRSIQAGPAVVHVIDAVLLSGGIASRLGLAGNALSPAPAPTLLPTLSPPPVSVDPSRPNVVVDNVIYSNIVAALRGVGNMSILTMLYNAASTSVLGPYFNMFLSAPYTLFAPTDAAFTAHLEARGTSAAALSGNEVAVGLMLLQHAVLGRAVRLEELTEGRTLNAGFESLVTLSLRVSRAGGAVRIVTPVSTANILRSGISAGVAQVHVVDAVLSS